MAVRVDARRAYQKLKRAELAMLQGSRKTAKTLAKIGVAYAQARAPYDRGPNGGSTARAIHAKPNEISKSAVKWIIVAPDAHPDAAARTGGFVRYMHSDKASAANHFRKDRDRKFMYSTRDYLEQNKAKVGRASFGQINIK